MNESQNQEVTDATNAGRVAAQADAAEKGEKWAQITVRFTPEERDLIQQACIRTYEAFRGNPDVGMTSPPSLANVCRVAAVNWASDVMHPAAAKPAAKKKSGGKSASKAKRSKR